MNYALPTRDLETRQNDKNRRAITKFSNNTRMNKAPKAICWLKSRYFFYELSLLFRKPRVFCGCFKKNWTNQSPQTNLSKLKPLPPSPAGYSYWMPGAREARRAPQHHPPFTRSAAAPTQLMFCCWYSVVEMLCLRVFAPLFLAFPLPPPPHSILCHVHFVCLYEHRASELCPRHQLNRSQFGEKYRRLINC